MNNTALFDYYYSRRPTTSRSVSRDPAGFTHWEKDNLPSFRESCRAHRAMRALLAETRPAHRSATVLSTVGELGR